MSEERIEYVPIDLIDAAPQVREHFDETALTGLAQSIRAGGLLQPLRTRKVADKYRLVDGERRYRACRLAGLTTIPVIVESRELSPVAILHRQLVANCQREDLTPLESAQAVDQLMKASGWSATQAATKLGFSNAKVTRLLALLALPDAIRDQVKSGAIPPTAAYELTKLGDPSRQAELAEAVACGRLTRDGLAGEIKNQRRQTGEPHKQVKRATAVIGDGRAVTVSAHDLSLEAFIAVLEDVLGRARKARPQGLTLNTFLKMLRDRSEG